MRALLMLAEMLTLRGAVVALIALERPLSRVRALMLLEVGSRGGAVITFITVERALPRMGELMHAQVVSSRGAKIALVALKLILRLARPPCALHACADAP